MSGRCGKWWSLAAVVAMLVPAAGAEGQSQLATRGPRFLMAGSGDVGERDASNAPVLRRRVSLDLNGVTVDDALKELSRRAGLELAYSPRVVALDQPVTLKARDITVAAALTEILLDVAVDVSVTTGGHLALVPRPRGAAPLPTDTGAVVGRVTDAQAGSPIVGATVSVDGRRATTTTGADGRYRLGGLEPGAYTVRARYIGYTPASQTVTVGAGEEAAADFALAKSAQELDQVVVTGTIVPTEVRALPTPVSVITAADIESQHIRNIDDIFRQLVPGAIAPDVTSQPELTFRSLRGASTLSGLGTIKVYIDGIEASERSVALVDPNSVDHIEVIRGPQAAAIYGSDAIAGVMQIFTRKGDSTLTRPELSAQAALGVIQSPYTSGALRQEYTASARGGAPAVRYNIGAGFSRASDWVPESAIEQPSVFASVGFGRNGLTVDISGRLYQEAYDFPLDPRTTETGFIAFSKPYHYRFVRRQETYGVRLSCATSRWWQHAVTAGIDLFGDNVRSTAPRLITPADSLLALSLRTERKVYVGYNTSATFGIGRAVSSVITAGFEHSTLTDQLTSTFGALKTTGTIQTAPGFPITATYNVVNNTGYFSQAQLNLHSRVFLTAGLRAEQNSNFGADLKTPVLPRAGLSIVHELGRVTAKLRGSYGRAILPPTPIQRNPLSIAGIGQVNIANPLLAPQRQEGVDGGIDLTFGTTGVLSVTYYTQVAKDLIQRVLLDASSSPQVLQWQNVARVKNTGWEFEGRVRTGLVLFSAQYAITNSAIQDLGPNYTGDLRVGDRPLQTPHVTGGATASLTAFRGTRLSAGFTYVGSQTNYDYLAQFRCFAGTGPCLPTLRDYQVVYPSYARINLAIEQRITPLVTGFVSVTNLANNMADEVNNQIPPRGRVTMAGFRTVW
jgi:outer membrane receptor protein involved in Fe transport